MGMEVSEITKGRARGSYPIMRYIERGLIGDRMRAVIVSEFCVGDQFGPRCGIIAAKDTKVGFDFLVDSFCFTVGLWMIGSGEGKVVV